MAVCAAQVTQSSYSLIAILQRIQLRHRVNAHLDDFVFFWGGYEEERESPLVKCRVSAAHASPLRRSGESEICWT